ncbi:hypothetical protein RN001_012929 [Aquatica leii]|uniref:Nudix hydrolase domain-containing protein n=1 Tax=Aquatica leii TaxID=1421715 RepID=A0AAN7SDI7_9COLE|nr:hypothetical protein RN001_012929 [Aquatica leii]
MLVFYPVYRIYRLGNRNSSFFNANNVLNEDNLRKAAVKFANMKPIRFQTQEPYKKAAVLIPLCVVDNKVSLLYTLRAANLKSHRAQVSFPGGMLDDKDKNLEYTALRETTEELGIKESSIVLWGTGKLIVTRGDLSVLPVIGQITEKLKCTSLNVNYNEVEDVFAVPLENLCNPKLSGYTQFRSGYSMPVFFGAPKKIWGLTALITNEFLKALMPAPAYAHPVKFVPMIKSHSFNSL